MVLVLYRAGDFDTTVFLLKKGLLRKETPLDIYRSRKWPIVTTSKTSKLPSNFLGAA